MDSDKNINVLGSHSKASEVMLNAKIHYGRVLEDTKNYFKSLLGRPDADAQYRLVIFRIFVGS